MLNCYTCLERVTMKPYLVKKPPRYPAGVIRRRHSYRASQRYPVRMAPVRERGGSLKITHQGDRPPRRVKFKVDSLDNYCKNDPKLVTVTATNLLLIPVNRRHQQNNTLLVQQKLFLHD